MDERFERRLVITDKKGRTVIGSTEATNNNGDVGRACQSQKVLWKCFGRVLLVGVCLSFWRMLGLWAFTWVQLVGVSAVIGQTMQIAG